MFFEEKTGALTFDMGMSLTPHMSRMELLAALGQAGGTSPDLGESGIVPFPACPAAGGLLAPVCYLQEDRLTALTLWVAAAGLKTALTAQQQRAFLFSAFRAKDPCPDTLRNCGLRGDFGVLTFCSDPRSGSASVRIAYCDID